MSETDKPGIKNIVEFALLAAGEPLDIGELRRLTAGEEGDVREALSALEGDWSGRSMRLARAAGGWQLVSREGYAEYLRRLRPKKPPRLSRQLLEVLAVIAYQQPATRGDIEQARGVSVSALHLATLEEFGWIEEVGRRETPGRPALFGTTKTFLSDLAIASLDELPKINLEDLAAEVDDDSAFSLSEKSGEGGDAPENNPPPDSEAESGGDSESGTPADSDESADGDSADKK